jgi:hypothetical protein
VNYLHKREVRYRGKIGDCETYRRLFCRSVSLISWDFGPYRFDGMPAQDLHQEPYPGPAALTSIKPS